MFKQFNINSTSLFTFFGFFITKTYLFLKNILKSMLFILRFLVEAFKNKTNFQKLLFEV